MPCALLPSDKRTWTSIACSDRCIKRSKTVEILASRTLRHTDADNVLDSVRRCSSPNPSPRPYELVEPEAPWCGRLKTCRTRFIPAQKPLRVAKHKLGPIGEPRSRPKSSVALHAECSLYHPATEPWPGRSAPGTISHADDVDKLGSVNVDDRSSRNHYGPSNLYKGTLADLLVAHPPAGGMRALQAHRRQRQALQKCTAGAIPFIPPY